MEDTKLSDKGELLKDSEKYRRLVTRLIYPTITRPYITYPIHVLNCFMDGWAIDPSYGCRTSVVHYLKSTPSQGLLFHSDNQIKLTTYRDFDWTGFSITRRFTTSCCVFLGYSLISWQTKRRKTVSLFSAELKYRATATGCDEVIWLRFLLEDLGIPLTGRYLLFCNSQTTLHIVANLVFHERTRHIEMDCHFMHDKIVCGTIVQYNIK